MLSLFSCLFSRWMAQLLLSSSPTLSSSPPLSSGPPPVQVFLQTLCPRVGQHSRGSLPCGWLYLRSCISWEHMHFYKSKKLTNWFCGVLLRHKNDFICWTTSSSSSIPVAKSTIWMHTPVSAFFLFPKHFTIWSCLSAQTPSKFCVFILNTVHKYM